MNAAIELSQHILNTAKKVKCAIIEVNARIFILTCNHSEPELRSFVMALGEEDYHAGYGSQELFGTIWFEDGSWSERYEYDGSECWEHKSVPEIPEELNPTYEGSKGNALLR